MTVNRVGVRFAVEAGAILIAAIVAGPLLHLVWWQVAIVVFAVLGVAIYFESSPATEQAAVVPVLHAPVSEEATHVRVLPEPEPVAVAVAAAPVRISGPPFNVWELERALETAGEPDDERSFLLQYLRDYAGSNGQLPPDFDDLVLESFGSLL